VELYNIGTWAWTEGDQLPSFESGCRRHEGDNLRKSPLGSGSTDDKFYPCILWPNSKVRPGSTFRSLLGEFVKEFFSFSLPDGIELKEFWLVLYEPIPKVFADRRTTGFLHTKDVFCRRGSEALPSCWYHRQHLKGMIMSPVIQFRHFLRLKNPLIGWNCEFG
jgi:hypothetical protein